LAKTLQRLTMAFNLARREDVAGPPARLSFDWCRRKAPDKALAIRAAAGISHNACSRCKFIITGNPV